jgi:hypothetical protein
MSTPTFNSFGNSLKIGSSSFKTGGKFTDQNHIFNLYDQAPFTTHLGLITAFNQMKLVPTPLLNQTELRKNIILVNGVTGRFTFSMPFELTGIRVIEDPNDVTISRLGIDNQPFRVIFSEDVFAVNDIVTYDFRDGKQLYIKSYVGQVGEGHEYEVVLVTQNPREDYFSRADIQPGVEFFKVGNILNEFDQEGSTAFTQTGELLFEQKLAGHRMVEHKITAYADMLEIPTATGKFNDMARNYLNPKSEQFIATFGAYKDGLPVKGTGKYATMIELLIMAELRRMEETQLMWGKAGTVTGSRNQAKTIKNGLYEQMKLGNRFKIRRYTLDILQQAFITLFANRPDIKIEDRYIKIQAGQGAYYEILKIFGEEAKGLPFVNLGTDLNIIRKAQFVNNSVQNLALGWQVVKIFVNGVGTIEVEHNPAFDVNTSRKADEPLIGQFPRWSYTAAILDVTDMGSTNATARTKDVEFMEGANQSANIFLIKPKQRQGDVISVIPGRGMNGTGLFGTSSVQGKVLSATKEPATTITIENHSEIWLKDPTRSVLIELDKNQPLFR